ncbi:restriction endonuclease subunit S [Enterobacter roggenkampii]|uniref:restriction endonuclease subunit S n=1 Tax=Enterobacter roggenkampii TaxID=1812935 RepID=UPI00374F309C
MAKYKAYPEYRDSGVEWLREIPLNWSYIPHKYLAVYYKGRNPTTLSSEPKRDCVPYLSMSYLRTNIVEHYTLVTSDARVVPDDLVLIIWDGSNAGEFIKSKRGILSSTMAVANVTSKLNHQYYWFSCNCIEPEIRRHANGMGIPHVNGEHLRHIAMPRPSIEEQIKISLFLIHETMKIDLLVEKQQQLIELLKEKRQALISHAVTKGLNPDMPMKDSGVEWLGDVPCHWNVVKLKYISTLNNQTLPDSTSKHFLIKYIDIGNVSKENGISNPEEMFFSEAPSRARRIVKDGDVIISTVRTYLEAIAIILNPPHNLVVSTGFAVIHPQKLSKKFSLYCFKDRKFIQKIISMSVGISYPAINASDLITIKIPFPEYLEQDEIGDFLHRKTAKIDTLIQKQLQQIELLKERRTALISAAVTGKIDLRDWTPPASSAEASLTAEETTA